MSRQIEHGTLPLATTCECTPCTVALMGASYLILSPGQAMTKAQHDALMANRDRPLTQSPAGRHHSVGNGHQLGELL